MEAGLVQGKFTVFASGNKAEINSVVKDDGEEIVDLMRGRLSGEQAPLFRSSPRPVAASGSVADELAKLADLHGNGVLTDDEFARIGSAMPSTWPPSPKWRPRMQNNRSQT